jgi:aerobic-type carbon monoxide dehydrogenase small subunit (CoxS/CutS family)
MDTIPLDVNGKRVEVVTEGDRTLLEVLREEVGLTGTKYGCGEGACGACSVMMGGKRVFSCQVPVSQAAGREVVTVEGLATGEELHPVQRAFLEEGAFQCGYCTPGMMVATVALLARHPRPTEEQIVNGLEGNVCRCCTYPRIVKAVRRAAELSAERKG